MTEEREVVRTEWRSGERTIGIVLVKIGALYCAYMGVASGISIHEDEQRIAEYGAKLSVGEARAFFPNLRTEHYYEGYK